MIVTCQRGFSTLQVWNALSGLAFACESLTDVLTKMLDQVSLLDSERYGDHILDAAALASQIQVLFLSGSMGYLRAGTIPEICM